MASEKKLQDAQADKRMLRRGIFQAEDSVLRKRPCTIRGGGTKKFEPDGWQREALMDLAGNPKVSIKSGRA